MIQARVFASVADEKVLSAEVTLSGSGPAKSA
jgi:hypothetical protein